SEVHLTVRPMLLLLMSLLLLLPKIESTWVSELNQQGPGYPGQHKKGEEHDSSPPNHFLHADSLYLGP
ncbi:MAG: hypothetical protein AAF662_16300, partial [Pseudomonadota bacterium]